MCAAVVRWDNIAFSTMVRLQCGVRQGGVLSPVLFAVFVNGTIVALSKFDNMFVGCILYANDRLLLFASLCDLQSMVDICCEELENLDMRLNVKKSQVVRIGRSHRKEVTGVVIDGKPTDFVNELKYLGWYILSADAFRVSAQCSSYACSLLSVL